MAKIVDLSMNGDSVSGLYIQIDGDVYAFFDEQTGDLKLHPVDLASKYPDFFTNTGRDGMLRPCSVVKQAQNLKDRFEDRGEKRAKQRIESHLKGGGIRKAFMVWATGKVDVKVPRIPRPWDYRITWPRLVRRS